MKNSLKRITALLLVFALAIVFIPAGGPGAAYAGEGEIDASMNGESGVITWEEYPGAAVYDIVINGNYYRSFGPGPGEVNIFNCIDEAYVDGLVKKASEYDIIISALGSDDASIATWSIQVGHEPNVDSLGALNFSSGVVSWDPYPGAEYYVVAAAYFEELTPDGSTAFDLDATMASYGAEPGHYTVRVKAYDDNNKLIAYAMDASFYEYTAPETEYGEIENVKIDENGIMTWDPVSGVSGYYVGIDNEWWDSVSGTSYDLNSQIDYCVKNGYLNNSGTHTIIIETNSPYKYYDWEGKHTHFLDNKEVETLFRYYGNTRFETSLKVADALKEKMRVEKFDCVILAFGNNYADALAGSYLSANAGAPILLVDSKQDHIKAVQDYIKKNLVSDGTIYLLGGTAVVPDSAVKGLSGYKVERLGGNDRYETNLKILKKAADIVPWYSYRLIVCSGTGFADSLSAAATGDPILLVRGTKLSDQQKTYLDQLKANLGNVFITVVGGEGAVSKDIFAQLKSYGDVYRVGGSDRYETSKLFAEHMFGGASSAVLAYGGTFPDGLCGGSLANALGGPLILAANNKTVSAAEFVKAENISYGAILGGPALISDASAKAIFDVAANAKIVVK